MLRSLTSYLTWHGFMNAEAAEGALPCLVIQQWIDEDGQIWWSVYARVARCYRYLDAFATPEAAFSFARVSYCVELLRPATLWMPAFPIPELDSIDV